MLSMRSSTPPWPGNRLPLSLRPARRLNMLSNRSPTTETSATTTQSATHADSRYAEHQRARHGSRCRSQHARRETFPSLAGADPRRELVTAEGTAAEIGADVCRRDQHEQVEEQHPAVRFDEHQPRETDGRRHQHQETGDCRRRVVALAGGERQPEEGDQPPERGGREENRQARGILRESTRPRQRRLRSQRRRAPGRPVSGYRRIRPIPTRRPGMTAAITGSSDPGRQPAEHAHDDRSEHQRGHDPRRAGR